MNASQRRILARSCNIRPGAEVKRKALGKAQATKAIVIGADPLKPAHIIVKRKDNQRASWSLFDVLRSMGLRGSALLG